MKEASLWVNLSRCETESGALNAPQCSVTRKDLHPAWLTVRTKFSGNQVCAQAWAPLYAL